MVATYEVRSTAGVVTQLYLIRNPWGSDGEYFGAWSDEDPIWQTNNYSTQVPFKKDTEDGLFFISQADFHISFDYISISY